MDNNRKTETLVGLFVLVGLLLLGGLILQFGRVREIFKDTYTLRVSFPNAAGIKEGSPVFLGGSRVGKVSHSPMLNPTFTGVIIDVELFKDVRVPADASFAIGSAGLMGDALVEIKPSGKESNQFIEPNPSKIIQGAASGGLADLQSQAEVVARKVDVVLDDVRTTLRQDVRTVLESIKQSTDRVNQSALSEATLKHFSESIEHLNKALTRVDEQVLDEANAANLKSAMADLSQAAASFKRSSANLEEASKRLGPMLDSLKPALERADKVMESAEGSLKSVGSAADAFAGTVRNITSGRGLLGALANDPKLRTEFSDLISNLKRNGVLFYRDNAEKQRAEKQQEEEKRKPAPKR